MREFFQPNKYIEVNSKEHHLRTFNSTFIKTYSKEKKSNIKFNYQFSDGYLTLKKIYIDRVK